MKHLFTLLLGVLLSTTIMAQNIINEAFVKYEITEVKSSDPQTEAMLQMMKGSTMDLYFKGNQQRMDVDMMGGMMKMRTLMNQNDDGSDNALFMDMMGQKIKVDMNEEQLQQYQDQNGQGDMVPTIEQTDEVKEIAGYSCKKVVCTFDNEMSFELVAYVTEALQSPKPVIQNAGNVDLGGFPLEYTVVNPEMTLTYTAQEVSETVEDTTFDEPEGYQPMTFDQFVQSMGAMGGGMGN